MSKTSVIAPHRTALLDGRSEALRAALAAVEAFAGARMIGPDVEGHTTPPISCGTEGEARQ
mgnify:CR=1 FL=1